MKLYAVFKNGKIELKENVSSDDCVLDVLKDEFKYIENIEDKRTKSKINFLNFSYDYFLERNKPIINSLEKQIKSKIKKVIKHEKHYISDGYYYVKSIGIDNEIFYHNEKEILSIKEIKGDNECFYFDSYSIDKHMSISYSDDGSEIYKLFLLLNKDKNNMIFIDSYVTSHQTIGDWLVYTKRPEDQMRSYQVVLLNIKTMKKKVVFQENKRNIHLSASISLDNESLIVSGSDGENEYFYILFKMKDWRLIFPMQKINLSINVVHDKVSVIDRRNDGYYIYLCPKHDIYIDSDKYLIYKSKFHALCYVARNSKYIAILEYYKEQGKSVLTVYNYEPNIILKKVLDGKYYIDNLSLFKPEELVLGRLLYTKIEKLFIDINQKNYIKKIKRFFEDDEKYDYKEDLIDGIRIVGIYNKEVGIKHALLIVYGSYGQSIESIFDSIQLALCDHGIACFAAFVRGGGENGSIWYEEGKMTSKKNTIVDTIKAGNYIKSKYLEKVKGKIGVWGTSAGGIAAAGAINQENVFNFAILEVPFVDVLGTMFDTRQALTEGEFNEFGDPRIPEMYYYIKSYSPYQNITKKQYPPTLIIVGMKDERVKYHEGIKFGLRMIKNGASKVYVKITDRGHFEFDLSENRIKLDAEIAAFIIESVNSSY
ncbi:MAG: prolyl oligopeptidase family serine peptidase [Candidatus Dojkabacteria bacterium]|nr:prolyl oligopeptidase family serine peptidase [Candidatus Dojkabacteria bacterium]